MQKRTLPAVDRVSMATMALCFVLYCSVGAAGYTLLGETTPADILKGLGGGAVVAVARASIAVKVACSYGMLHLVVRTCLEDLLLGRGRKFSTVWFYGEAALFVAITMAVAIFVPGIQTAMGFSGVIVVVMVAIFPVLLMRRISATRWEMIVGWALVVFGVVIGGISLAVEIRKLV